MRAGENGRSKESSAGWPEFPIRMRCGAGPIGLSTSSESIVAVRSFLTCKALPPFCDPCQLIIRERLD
jgi:hypothetical protein